MQNAVNLWGPALIVCLTVILGFIWNNARFADVRAQIESLRNYIDGRFNAQDKRFDDVNRRIDDMNKRIDDLRDFVRSEIRRLEDRTSLIRPN